MVVETSLRSGPGATTVVKVRCYHVVKIQGYSRTLTSNGARPAFSSPRFRAGGGTWHVSYRPMGSPYRPENTEYVSIYLVQDGVVVVRDAAAAFVAVWISFSLLKQDGTPAMTWPANVNDICRAGYKDQYACGYEKFIKREELERRASEFLRDDCLSIRVHVHAVNQQGPYVAVPPSDLHRHFGGLLSSKEDADVEFHVGGETFAAHRAVVAARSPVFMAELFGPMKATNRDNAIIQVHDMEPQVFDALLAFIYTDAWPEETMKNEDEPALTQHLLVAADRYGLERLKHMCEDRLCSYPIFSTEAAATILALAEQHCCGPRLKDACFEFLLAYFCSCSSETSSRALVESTEFEFLVQSCPSVAEELLARVSERETAEPNATCSKTFGKRRTRSALARHSQAQNAAAAAEQPTHGGPSSPARRAPAATWPLFVLLTLATGWIACQRQGTSDCKIMHQISSSSSSSLANRPTPPRGVCERKTTLLARAQAFVSNTMAARAPR